ncbi:MAG: hypothetical protein BGP16_15280 [Sphingobium sp. 66-54]|nr:MAG: hypothetical protein BGP16_15280 [Sphingobium sp. 66-54]
MFKFTTLALSVATMAAVPALAGNALVSPGAHKGIAKSSLSATPDGEWNRLGRRDGKFVELWTKDGDSLNKVTFFGGVPAGEPLFREADKKNRPLPKVSGTMLMTDIPTLLESSYRIQFNVNRISIDDQEPATLGGHPGLKFRYTFVSADDEVERKGEAIGAIVKDRVFLVSYEAPAIYFFEKDLPAFHQLAATLKM